MRRVLLLLLVVSGSARADQPCRYLSIGLGDEKPPRAQCDGLDIEIAHACHCRPHEESRPWGSTKGLELEVAKTARVVSGDRVDIPFTLRYRGSAPVELDFRGGEVTYHTGTWRGRKRVATAPCGEISMLPETITLTLRPGAVVRGTASWKASTSQLDSCDLADPLSPGRYRVGFATVSGEPELTSSVVVTVVRRR